MSQKPNTLADFKAKFDQDVVVPNKIKAALAALGKEGQEAWEFEMDFVKRAGLSQTQLGTYRGQFEKHVVLVRETGRSERKVWFADAKVASKARGE